jgi:hypothetical protein
MSKPPDPDGITASRLEGFRVFMPRDMRDDVVLLRVRAYQLEHWYRLPREDFISLAEHIADQAAQMKAHN